MTKYHVDEWRRAAVESQHRADRKRIEALNRHMKPWPLRYWAQILMALGAVSVLALIVLNVVGTI